MLHRGRAWRSAPAEPRHGLTLVSRGPVKRYDGSSRQIPVVTFFALTGCWDTLDPAVAERPGPTTPRFSTVRRDDHVKTTVVNKVILVTDSRSVKLEILLSMAYL